MDFLEELLSAINEATGLDAEPFTSTTPNFVPCISYQIYRQGDNAVVSNWRFRIRITAETLEEALEIDEAIAETLCSLGDEEKYDTLQIRQNGGGTMEDPETRFPQLLDYYDIMIRS